MKHLIYPFLFINLLFASSCKKDVGLYLHNDSDYTLVNFRVDSTYLGDIKPHKTARPVYLEQVYWDCCGSSFRLSCTINSQPVNSYYDDPCLCDGDVIGKNFGLIHANVHVDFPGTDSAVLKAVLK